MSIRTVSTVLSEVVASVERVKKLDVVVALSTLPRIETSEQSGNSKEILGGTMKMFLHKEEEIQPSSTLFLKYYKISTLTFEGIPFTNTKISGLIECRSS